MTISITVDVTPDLFADADWPLFDGDRARSLGLPVVKVGRASFTAKRVPNWAEADPLVIAAWRQAVCAVAGAFPGRALRPWLFVSPGWQRDNRLLRYHGLWAGYATVLSVDNVKTVSDQVEFSSSDGIRFAGVVELTKAGGLTAAKLIRTERTAAIILSDRGAFGSEGNIRELFAAAYPEKKGVPQWEVDWMTFSVGACLRGDVVVRVFGVFDDPEIGVDLFASSLHVEEIERSLLTRPSAT